MIHVIELNSPNSLADYGKRTAIELIKEVLGDAYSGVFEDSEVKKYMADVINAPFLMQAKFVYIDNELVDIMISDPCSMMVKPECDIIYRDKWLKGFVSREKMEELCISEREKEMLNPYKRVSCVIQYKSLSEDSNVRYYSTYSFRRLCYRNNYNLIKDAPDSHILSVKPCDSPFISAMIAISQSYSRPYICLGRKFEASPFFLNRKEEDEWILFSLIMVDEEYCEL